VPAPTPPLRPDIAEIVTLRPQEAKWGQPFTFPVNPESVSMTRSRGVTEIGIVNFRQIARFTPREVETITFTALLPDQYDAGYCNYSNLKRPIDAYALLSRTWIPNADVPVLDLVVAGSLNIPVVMTACNRASRPAEPGDLYVDITLRAWVPTLIALVGSSAGSDAAAATTLVTTPAGSTITADALTGELSATVVPSGSRPVAELEQATAVETLAPHGYKPPSLPARPPGLIPPATGTRYTTIAGDTLWLLAKSFYGDGSKWAVIYNANADALGGNPNDLPTGTQLYIPA